ncbi:hypothetical protein DFR33_10127 [Bradymonas sediminis]|nr:hypothetical protein DFR33_10127 [Bradymonas sediminis]
MSGVTKRLGVLEVGSNPGDTRNRSVVALTITDFDKSRVSTSAGSHSFTFGEVIKDLSNESGVLKYGASLTASVNRIFLTQGDQSVGDATQLFGFRVGSLDQFILDQAARHIMQNGLAMGRFHIEFAS